MSEQHSLLLELGTEELPAGSVLALAEAFADGLAKALFEAGLTSDATPRVFATPRRLACIFSSVMTQQPDQQVQRRGPAVQAAFDESGAPSKAVLGFARSCGVDVNALDRLATDKGEWLVFNSVQAGQSVTEVLQQTLPAIIRQLPMPRRMRWSDGSEEFLRPVQWFVALHGESVLPLQLLGLQADKLTMGHRFHEPDPVAITSPESYEQMLRDARVIADYDERKILIRSQLAQSASEAGGHLDVDEALLDEVTALVEWPQPVVGKFDAEFLQIPREALIQTMEENQRYFALYDSNGQLMNAFITIANIESSNKESVRAGNERVIRPRFKDTMFFWENDNKRPLKDIRNDLGKVLFQERLGTVLDKSDRLIALSDCLTEFTGADKEQTRNAAALCRCDLLTDTVTELAKMQGIAGRYLAEREGYPEAVCRALEQQYWPKGAGGDLPEAGVSSTLALADKLDTLTGIYGIGLKPSGTRDPFALRRASLGLLRILIEQKVDLDLEAALRQAAGLYGDKLDSDFDVGELLHYINDRLVAYYQDHGITADIVEAVLGVAATHPADIDRRVLAVAAFRKRSEAESLAAANKRIRNILKKSGQVSSAVDTAMLTDDAEKSLASVLSSLETETEQRFTQRDYLGALTAMASLQVPVDTFFDQVMVMVDDEAVRNNRLAILSQVGRLCTRVADISRLQPELVHESAA